MASTTPSTHGVVIDATVFAAAPITTPCRIVPFAARVINRLSINHTVKTHIIPLFFELGELPTMENFSVAGANAGHMWTKISAGSVDPLRFYGHLKFSLPLAVMVTKISKVHQNRRGRISKISIRRKFAPCRRLATCQVSRRYDKVKEY